MILDGECGQFNPDIINALVSSADKIKLRLKETNSVELDAKQDAKRFADSVIEHYKQYL